MTHDKDIREPLFDFLEQEYGRCRILEEKNTGSSRADVVMITETEIFGVEIKSDADTYARLAGQVRDYDRYYDRNIVVVGTSHVLHIEEHVPDYWGIITVEPVDGVLDFYFLRRPADNPKVTWKKKLEILWRPELAQLQELHSMPKYKDKSKDYVIGRILERVPDRIAEEDLKAEMCGILMERDYTTAAAQLAEYRKSETQKKLESEKDPIKRLWIMMEKPVVGRKRKKRRRLRG